MFKFGFQEEHVDNEVKSKASDLIPPNFVEIENLKTRQPRISYSHPLPRRDLFDVRFELMNSDELSEEEKLLLSGTEDVRKNVYEGGLKVWEGTFDLVEALKQHKSELKFRSVIELGCGAGVPSCELLFECLVKNKKNLKFVLADYNSAVLKLVTMPNVILSWMAAVKHEKLNNDNELVLSSELITEMETDLKERNVEIQFVAGAWGGDFCELVGGDFDLVLASETIYSLDSISEFTDVLCGSLSTNGAGLVAAKRVYFGVGGGVVEFERLLSLKNVHYKTVLERGNVGRVVIEVTR